MGDDIKKGTFTDSVNPFKDFIAAGTIKDNVTMRCKKSCFLWSGWGDW
jgi:hypothetical protein